MNLILDDLILIEYRVVGFQDKKIIPENPDAVGMMGKGNFAQENAVRAKNLELVDITFYDLGFSDLSGNREVQDILHMTKSLKPSAFSRK